MYWAEADQIAQELRRHLQSCAGIEQLELAGSYRRGRDTVGDLDILVVAGESAEVMDRFGSFPGVADVLGRGDTKMSVRLTSGFQVDLRIVPRGVVRRGPAVLHRLEGPQRRPPRPGQAARTEDQRVRRVPRRGRSGNLRRGRGRGRRVRHAGPAVLPARAARSAAGVRVGRGGRPAGVGPPGRHPRRPARAHLGDRRPRHDRGDGRGRPATRLEVPGDHRPFAARDDGSRAGSETAAGPVGTDRPAERTKLGKGFTILKGIECDILEKGGLDLPDDVLAQADWVVASVHYGQKQPREQITKRIVDALANPYVSCIAHPDGPPAEQTRSVRSRPGRGLRRCGGSTARCWN